MSTATVLIDLVWTCNIKVVFIEGNFKKSRTTALDLSTDLEFSMVFRHDEFRDI